MNGTAFLATLGNLPLGPARSAAILAALDSHVRWPLVDVPILDGSGAARGSFSATADYFAIGEPDDFVRVPVDGPTAQRIAEALGMVIPTPRMVRLIHRAAPIKVQPILRAAAPEMTSVSWFVWHSRAVDQAIAAFLAAHPEVPGDSLCGDVKKNVTRSNARVERPGGLGRLALFGEHVVEPVTLSHNDGSPRVVHPGEPIQELTLFHEATYADESHGLRLCGATVTVDGKLFGTDEVLQDPALAELLSDEGPLRPEALRYG